MEIFWLVPNMASRQEQSGFAWVNAEVLYSRMNLKQQDKIQNLKMIHCENGLLELDLLNQSWNGGCPATEDEYDLVRVTK